MTKVVELLDAAKAAMGVTSDYAIAQELGIGRARVSEYRKGSYSPEAYVVLRLAQIAGEDPAKAIADVAAEREKHPDRKRWLENFRTAACWIGLAIVTTFVTPPENAHAASMRYASGTPGIQIIAVLRRWFSSAWSRLASRLRDVRPLNSCPGW